jgi:DNA-binding LacI/PurR family transcriptional regulator
MRLPVRGEFERQYNVSTVTMQRTMAILERDGFIVSAGSRGTFVAERPPHLHRIGLALMHDPNDPKQEHHTKFATFLHRQAMAMHDSGQRPFTTYTYVGKHPTASGNRRLLDDVRAHRLAGLIFDAPSYLDQEPLDELKKMPHPPIVAIGEESRNPSVSMIHPPISAVAERAWEFLAKQPRRIRRPAVLMTSSGDDANPIVDAVYEGAARHGFNLTPAWLQFVHPPMAGLAGNLIHLLLEARERPDALIILDDVLVEPATAALAERGVRCPQDLLVVAHANFPHVTPSRVPATRLGFDVRQVLRTCLDVIDRRRRGDIVAPVTDVSPLFDDEIGAEMTAEEIAHEA